MPAPATCSMCGEPLRAASRSTASANGGSGLSAQASAATDALPPVSGSMPNAAVKGPRLLGKMPDGTEQLFPIDGVKVTLGRHPANTLRLVDREVSKEHAAIERIGATFVLKDLGSSNGTFVNGRRIRELRLKDGDEISLGNSKLVFQSGEPATQPGGNGFPAQGGVTIVGAAHSMPAFLAQIAQAEDTEFRPAEKLTDLGALRQDYEKLRIAHEFHRQVGVERDQKSLLDKILKVSFQLLAADNGVIFLPDAANELKAAAVLRRKPTD
ncbi:MAG: FHA domain-containing protein, partial [Myxococcaceae bacterium]